MKCNCVARAGRFYATQNPPIDTPLNTLGVANCTSDKEIMINTMQCNFASISSCKTSSIIILQSVQLVKTERKWQEEVSRPSYPLEKICHK